VSSPPLRVALVAEEAAGVQTLQGLVALEPAVEIRTLLTSANTERPVVLEAARKLGIEPAPAELVRSPSLAEELVREEIDLLLNVHSLFLVHPTVVGAPTIGSFNLHPGPLPEYAGLNVPSWAVYNGEATHGVTLHWMDDGIDTGPIAWSERFDLTAADTGLSVSGRCVRLGVPLVSRLVQTALADRGGIPRSEQDRTRRRYFGAGPPDEGRLDWNRSAAEILRFVRAADYAPFTSPWPHPVADLEGVELGVAKAVATGRTSSGSPGTVLELSEDGATVSTANELVVVQRVWLDGRYRKPAEALAH
jgi:methionyl-tRNA formyltransferase